MTTYKRYYAIEPRPLGEGGWARILAGVHRTTGERHAVKAVNSFSNEESIGRLRREVYVQQHLQAHTEHVMPVIHSQPDDGWYSMPIASRRMQDLPRPVGDEHLLAIVRSITAALDAAHHMGFFHRDLSPGNVLRMEVGGRQKWVVSDWGMVSKPAPGKTYGIQTRGAGTPGFAAPETWDDEIVADQRADIYSLGRLVAWARKPRGKLEQNVIWVPPDAWSDFVVATTRHDRDARPADLDEVAALLGPLEAVLAVSTPARFATRAIESGRVEDFRRSGGALWVHIPPSISQPQPWGWVGHHGACGRPGYYCKARGQALELTQQLIAALLHEVPEYVKTLENALND